MIDKIEARLSSSVTFRKEILALIRQMNYATGKSFMMPSRFYVGVGDLRPLGIDALLHYHYKRGIEGSTDRNDGADIGWVRRRSNDAHG